MARIYTLLAIDPAERLTATAALRSEFFTTKPYACEPSSLPNIHSVKRWMQNGEMMKHEGWNLFTCDGSDNYCACKSIDIILRAASKTLGGGARKTRARDRARAVPAPEANAELQSNVDADMLFLIPCHLKKHANAKSKSEKFPPPHQDGALGFPLGASQHIDPSFVPPDVPFSTTFTYSKETIQSQSGPLVETTSIGGRTL
ncbi:Detected protein of confused Function [Hibiscus syriacus]|uniref:Detected protein of confused Function n=1 Tax=Hibiscus syriacus TaxID=106335 RepID=A0A6A2XTL0_HIBSY|nr:Detected protein of confused Function [Hibiscus syriacus]